MLKKFTINVTGFGQASWNWQKLTWCGWAITVKHLLMRIEARDLLKAGAVSWANHHN